MKLLQIDSSALGAQSATRELTRAIVAQWKALHQGAALVQRDLDQSPIPHLTGDLLARRDPEGAALGEAVLQEFLDAEVVIIGAPMYNFSIPSTLKAWIDRIAIAGRTFRYTTQGPEGMAGGRKLIVASARGSALGDDSPADFQEAYLRQLFGFLGIRDIEFVRAEGLALSPEHRERGLRAAHEAIGSPLAAAA